MIKICAWCENPMGILSRAYRIFRLKKKVSHGICWKCHRAQMEKLQNFSGTAYHTLANSQDQFKEVA